MLWRRYRDRDLAQNRYGDSSLEMRQHRKSQADPNYGVVLKKLKLKKSSTMFAKFTVEPTSVRVQRLGGLR